jgi:hypothetical protein
MMEYPLPENDVVTEAFNQFRGFLTMSWPSIDQIMWEHDWDNDPYFLEEWLDDNWMHLFVRQVLGQNCDFQPFSSSIASIQKSCHKYRLELVCPRPSIFVALGSNLPTFSIAPPFDQVQVLLEDKQLALFPLEEAEFRVVNVVTT